MNDLEAFIKQKDELNQKKEQALTDFVIQLEDDFHKLQKSLLCNIKFDTCQSNQNQS